MNQYKQQVESILVSLSMVILAGVCINVGSMLMIFWQTSNLIVIQGLLAVSAALGFIVIPIVMLKQLGYTLRKLYFNTYIAIVLAVLIIGISCFVLKSDEIIHALIIATGEEVLFRYIIFSVLLGYFKKSHVIVIGSILFAVILHINGDLVYNVVIKFPASIALYVLAEKYGLQSSIAMHWFYNILVGSFV